jgi:hypothetical protein
MSAVCGPLSVVKNKALKSEFILPRTVRYNSCYLNPELTADSPLIVPWLN